MTKAAKSQSRLQWESKIGPASVLGIAQLVVMIAGGGVLWGILTTKVDVVSTNALDLKQSFIQTQNDQKRETTKRDDKIAAQNERIGKIETSVGYISSAVSRIEAAIAKP